MKKLTRLLLCVLVGALLIGNCQKSKKIDKLTVKTATLPDSQQATIKVADNKVTATIRHNDGSVSAKVQYVPPEGNISIVQPTDGTAAKVDVKRGGFTFRPALHGMAGKELKIGLATRLVYFNRYGAGLGISHEMEPYLFADRRIDDFVGILKNTTIGVYGGPHTAGIMIGVYF